MKVLKEGQLPGEKVYRVTCGNCHSELEFARKEAKYTSDQRDGPFLTVQCPVCGNSIHTNV